MKDYFLFPNEGGNIKIEKNCGQYKITIETNCARFSKEKLKDQLTKFLAYLEKYGNETN